MMPAYVALLRAVNVGGRNRVPMAELRAAGEAAGLQGVQTYVQSGNLVFRSSAGAGTLEGRLEELIREHFGIEVPVVVRTAKAWVGYVASNPFQAEAAVRPALVHLCLAKTKPPAAAVRVIEEKALAGEQVVLRGDAIWIDYPSGSGRSKITPAVLDRAVGSSVTARNWNTVQKLAEMVGTD